MVISQRGIDGGGNAGVNGKQIALSSVVTVLLVAALSVPVMSFADEARNRAAMREAEEAAAMVDADGGLLALGNGNATSAMGDLDHRNKPEKESYQVEDPDSERAQNTANQSANGKESAASVRMVLVASGSNAARAAEEAAKPLPKDAILGVRNIKRKHVDMPTERLIASVGEQARYIGTKEGIPASILIAATIRENNRPDSALSKSITYSSYGTYIETIANDMTGANAKKRGVSLSENDTYKSALGKLRSAGLITKDEAEALENVIKLYELDRYDEPLELTLKGTMNDKNTGKERDLLYSDYVNLERIATSYIGTPYVWGGSNELTGFDCSGLVQWTYKQAMGIDLPRTTFVQQYMGESVPLDIDELRMGDLLFFYTPSEGTHHVAMYLADGYYIHAPCSGDVVKITSMEEFAPTFARRVVNFKTGDVQADAQIEDILGSISTVRRLAIA